MKGGNQPLTRPVIVDQPSPTWRPNLPDHDHHHCRPRTRKPPTLKETSAACFRLSWRLGDPNFLELPLVSSSCRSAFKNNLEPPSWSTSQGEEARQGETSGKSNDVSLHLQRNKYNYNRIQRALDESAPSRPEYHQLVRVSYTEPILRFLICRKREERPRLSFDAAE